MKNFNWNFVLAIVAALVTIWIVVFGVEMISHSIYPPPLDLDTTNNEAMKGAMKKFFGDAPMIAILLIPIAWVCGAFAGSIVGSLICRPKKRTIFFIVAIFTVMAALMMMILYPPPWYYWVISIFIFPAALLGSRMVPEQNS